MSTPENRLLQIAKSGNLERSPTEALPKSGNRLLEIAKGNVGITGGEPYEADIGVVGSFGAGVKKGVLEPITFIVGKSEVDPRIDSAAEKTSEFLGSMVGMGISFIPFSVGTGFALKGVGIVAGDTLGSKAAYGFLKNVIAGTAQFAGTSEKLEDLPENLALGAGFGAAIEGVFLVRAMRTRGSQQFFKDLFDTGSPIHDVPVTSTDLSIENALVPTDAKSPERLIDEFADLRNPNVTNEQALANLTQTYETTIYIPGLKNADGVVNHAQARLEGAQVLRRKILGGEAEDVLIHNPVDPTDRLTPKQIAQWESTGFFDGMAVEYRGKTYAATGAAVAVNKVQIKDPFKPHAVFAAGVAEVTRGTLGRVFSPSSRKFEELARIAAKANDFIGFAVPNAANGAVRRGIIRDIQDFEVVSSLKSFIEANRADILKYEAPDFQSALRAFAEDKGIKGLVEKENGITKRVHIFDQNSVQYQQEVPRLGIDVDEAVIFNTPDGQSVIESFVPSWKNQITGLLRSQGFKEKEINEFIELQRGILGNQVEELMDDEFKGIIRSAEVQFGGGCR